eukprot:CAMPEP_0203009656 /NCGR_PEP_ID=MMETSP1401-20130829/9596_1 /ASSEMBLY_ACC=CAM_ASM_000894 /TAXON_ID=38833 /ORGANISM="Micromonas pusilla, Strain CCAC1681" /LENGTH=201 /DNA_ID=CAMNT_0049751329 /DNA_START=123 /DNA_END=724 /DNA_ORIENTATION=+
MEPHAILEVPGLYFAHLVHLAPVAEERERRREPHVRRGVRQGVDVREHEVRVRERATGVAERGEHAGAVRAPRRAKLHHHQFAFRGGLRGHHRVERVLAAHGAEVAASRGQVRGRGKVRHLHRAHRRGGNLARRRALRQTPGVVVRGHVGRGIRHHRTQHSLSGSLVTRVFLRGRRRVSRTRGRVSVAAAPAEKPHDEHGG